MGARAVDVKITGSNASLKRAIQDSERHLDGMRRSMLTLGSVARSASLALGGLALGKSLFVDPIKSAGDFQQKLQVLKATSGATSGELKRMSALAIKLGADIRLPATTAQDAADAMLELSKGGLKAKAAMGAVRGVLLLSTAAQIDNVKSAKAVVSALKTFGLQAKDSTKVVDDFAGAANASIADIQDVIDALQFAGQGFKALHVPVGDATTAIAEMADAGQKGGVAGAALNVAMTKLAAPTLKAKAMMKDLGINVFDAHDKFIGMRGAIANISPIIDKMSDKQRLATLATLAGTRGMRALNIVLAGGVQKWDDYHKRVTKAGQAQKLANAQTAGFNGKMKALQSTLETLQLKLGMKLLPFMSRFVGYLGKIAGAKDLSVAVKIAWHGAVSVAKELKDAISEAMFGASGDLGTLHGGVAIGKNIKIDQGFVGKFKQAFAAVKWDDVGHRIADSISRSLKFSDRAFNGILAAALKWTNAHSGEIAAVGVVIGITMFNTLLDPSFWAAHWKLMGAAALNVISVAFPPGKVAGLAERFIASPLLRGLGRFAPGAAKAIELGAIRMAVALERLGATLPVKALRLADRIVSFIAKGFGKLGKLVKLALTTGIIDEIVQLVGAAFGWGTSIAGELARGILHGLEGLPGKILAAVTPGGHGNKNTSTGNTGRFRRPAATGAFVSGNYSAGDRVPAMLAGGEAVLNPMQISMVGRDRVMGVLAATGAPTIGGAFSGGKLPDRGAQGGAGATAVGALRATVARWKGALARDGQAKDSLAQWLFDHSDGAARGTAKKPNPKHAAWQSKYNAMHDPSSGLIGRVSKDSKELAAANKALAAAIRVETRAVAASKEIPNSPQFERDVNALNATLAEDSANNTDPLGNLSGAERGDLTSLVSRYQRRIAAIKALLPRASAARKDAINQELATDFSTMRGYQDQLNAAPNVADSSGDSSGSADPGTISDDAQAQIDQLNQKLGVANYAAAIANAQYGALTGPGDIGMGGPNALATASGGPNIYIQTLHPADPRTLAAIGDAATRGQALQPFVTSPRLALNI